MATTMEFAAFLNALAVRCPRFAPKVDKALADAWYAHFMRLPAEKLNAIAHEAATRFDQFPSIRELLELAGTAPRLDEDIARESAERIFSLVCKRGWAAKNVEAELGEVAWAVVKAQGGWQTVCEMLTFDNAPSLKAQWRELAEALSRKLRSGAALDAAPRFEGLPSPDMPEGVSRALKALSDGVVDLSVRRGK